MNPQAINIHRGFPPSKRKVSISVRSHIESLDAGLTSVNGALEVISMIQSRHLVTKLILGHNELGDDGCEVLFDYLISEAGCGHGILEISLNSNQISDRGLYSISRFLQNNTSLRKLFLQNNAFAGDPAVVAALTVALNSSHLDTLSLTTNPRLSDSFIAHLLPTLDAPYLRELQLSVLGLTHTSSPYIIEYISSPRCQLTTLKLNGNRIGLRGARGIVRAVHRHNFTLSTLELFANGLVDAEVDTSSETAASSEDDDAIRTGARSVLWRDGQKELARILLRNKYLGTVTQREAFVLLRYARALLLRSGTQGSIVEVPSTEALLQTIGSVFDLVPSSALLAPARAFPFSRLPMELQLYILSFLAPTLSSAQRIRVCTYAASLSTLPSLLPALISRQTMSRSYASTMPLGGVGLGVGMMLRKRHSSVTYAGASHDPAISRRDEERAKWLMLVRCNAFELEDDAIWSKADCNRM
ncbi:uncharacterized protein FIBRA_06963 [Fibroporia radiculosa]|uniref:F-box domain-containing protein n=1 Tax=Fibroporia radiculosa TaxID=599839 RepID=J4HZX6_9APHY|nr:uncharacterized protein FIBRA_06963 [Fibroporia radiculosa]CCM04772.1 predicted protein [Fibroporia radiculosa]